MDGEEGVQEEGPESKRRKFTVDGQDGSWIKAEEDYDDVQVLSSSSKTVFTGSLREAIERIKVLEDRNGDLSGRLAESEESGAKHKRLFEKACIEARKEQLRAEEAEGRLETKPAVIRKDAEDSEKAQLRTRVAEFSSLLESEKQRGEKQASDLSNLQRTLDETSERERRRESRRDEMERLLREERDDLKKELEKEKTRGREVADSYKTRESALIEETGSLKADVASLERNLAEVTNEKNEFEAKNQELQMNLRESERRVQELIASSLTTRVTALTRKEGLSVKREEGGAETWPSPIVPQPTRPILKTPKREETTRAVEKTPSKETPFGPVMMVRRTSFERVDDGGEGRKKRTGRALEQYNAMMAVKETALDPSFTPGHSDFHSHQDALTLCAKRELAEKDQTEIVESPLSPPIDESMEVANESTEGMEMDGETERQLPSKVAGCTPSLMEQTMEEEGRDGRKKGEKSMMENGAMEMEEVVSAELTPVDETMLVIDIKSFLQNEKKKSKKTKKKETEVRRSKRVQQRKMEKKKELPSEEGEQQEMAEDGSTKGKEGQADSPLLHLLGCKDPTHSRVNDMAMAMGRLRDAWRDCERKNFVRKNTLHLRTRCSTCATLSLQMDGLFVHVNDEDHLELMEGVKVCEQSIDGWLNLLENVKG
ncbi:hypothetical protein PMAYCL1PPCAC_07921, partial [Pristionchus mayeri]